MARIPMVTRTIQTTKVNALCQQGFKKSFGFFENIFRADGVNMLSFQHPVENFVENFFLKTP